MNDTIAPVDSDEISLARMGYSQELHRGFSAFSNYALSLSIICILAGGITSFHLGFCAVGPAAIGIGWPLAVVFSLCVAATMAQIASAFPTAGGIYHWASLFGGRGMGWFAAWFNLAGLVTVLAAINVGTWRFVVSGLLDGQDPGPTMQIIAVAIITLTQVFFNLLGTRIVSSLTSFSGWWILAVSLSLTLAFLLFGSPKNPLTLFEFHNFSGIPEGATAVWPATDSMAWLFLLALLLPAYTITGFDACAHAAEETHDAARNVPRGIIQSVLVSGVAGWILLAAAVLVIDDNKNIAIQGERAFLQIMIENIPRWLRDPMYGSILLAQYFCGLATVTSASRMAFAFARDGGLPGSPWLRRISRRTMVPANSIWAVAIASVSFTIYADVYATITAACTILLYASYAIPTLLGLWAHGRTWTAMGPWQLGIWFKPLAFLSLVGTTGLLFIGTQPPSEKAGYVVVGLTVTLIAGWFIFAKRRFPGPLVNLHSLQNTDGKSRG
jgi:amino acid transporter